MLTLYRRHTKGCHVHKTRLSPRAKRRYMDCQCPIWLYGRTRDALVARQSTGTRDLAAAEAQRLSLLKPDQDTVTHGPRIDHCVVHIAPGRGVRYMRDMGQSIQCREAFRRRSQVLLSEGRMNFLTIRASWLPGTSRRALFRDLAENSQQVAA
jgi:hypothetical protein